MRWGAVNSHSAHENFLFPFVENSTYNRLYVIYLLIVSLIWSFSFGLIKHNLAGIDPNFVAWTRMFLAFPLFLPFLRHKMLTPMLTIRLISIGAVQFGLMYSTYLYAFQYLAAYQVALFTIFTPIYVTLINDFYARRLQVFYLGMAILAVIGAGLIRYQEVDYQGVLMGFLLMQASNVCFAFGQIEYRRIRRQHRSLKDREIYALLYLGAVIVTSISTTVTQGWINIMELTWIQVLVLLYLGFLASGLGFFLWNKGALETNPGSLAVFNNIKIPLAVFVSLLVFGEKTDLFRLLGGGGLMILAVVLAERQSKKNKSNSLPREKKRAF